MRHDLYHNLIALNALNTQAIASDTTTDGVAIDLSLYNNNSVLFVAKTGAVTAGDVQLKVQHSDDNVTYADVDADYDLLGTEAGTNLDAANKTAKLGYRGIKRYVRASVVTDNSADLTVGVTAIIGDLAVKPDETQVR
jgi:hypothetical protein